MMWRAILGGAANESAAATATATKRLRRKKTFAELKEEEGMLLKEKLHLKKELASLRATFEEQRAKNESLKKMKVEVDFNLKYTEKFSTNSNMAEETSSTLTHQRESSNHDTIPPTLPFTGSGSFEAQSQKSKSSEDECVFILPDLNMIPSED
ncbi:uncharacterized protein LOC111004928 [Momordica charantia]|uniref:Uncharacterized protein LOC111004928 n=1 Tax=Momordica charantia TaxID=3673 RepID=A0A6J1BQS2_MOMCH|nr:uncharacterized protein LOC111004928 [Momordica charantia]